MACPNAPRRAVVRDPSSPSRRRVDANRFVTTSVTAHLRMVGNPGRKGGRPGTPAAPATLTAVERPETPAEAAISDRGGPRRKEVASRERNKIGDLLVRQPSITLQRVSGMLSAEQAVSNCPNGRLPC